MKMSTKGHKSVVNYMKKIWVGDTPVRVLIDSKLEESK